MQVRNNTNITRKDFMMSDITHYKHHANYPNVHHERAPTSGTLPDTSLAQSSVLLSFKDSLHTYQVRPVLREIER